MSTSIKSILDELNYKVSNEDEHIAEIFKENGYCVIPKFDCVREY